MEGKWLSVLEYAAFKKKSISTVRRYIKANRVKHKDENGKYFIWVKNYLDTKSVDERKTTESLFELERLRKENSEIKQELVDARMLIELYENGHMLAKKSMHDLPELPTNL